MPAMTFVQLVDRLRVECGVSGSTLISVQNLSGELQRLKNWIGDAYNEIQTSYDGNWKFLLNTFQFNTVANKQSYNAAADCAVTDLDDWDLSSFWLYNPTLGLGDQVPIGQMDWMHFREQYVRGVQTPQRPMCFSEHPNKDLWMGPLPDQAYTFNGQYWRLPQVLVNDSDTPVMPPRFHMVIVYMAMKKYGGYEAAQEILSRAQSEGGTLYNQLLQDQLPPVRVNGGGFDVA